MNGAVVSAKRTPQGDDVQAARWRLIKSPPGPPRRQVLSELIGQDVLGLLSSGQSEDSVCSLLAQSSSDVTTEMVSLLSAIASDSSGRCYILGASAALLPALFRVLQEAPQTKLGPQKGVDTTLPVKISCACKERQGR